MARRRWGRRGSGWLRAAYPAPGTSFPAASRSSSPPVLPANSAQGKILWELSKVRERVVGGKGGRGELVEGSHLLGAFPGASVLSLALCNEREERQRSRAWGEVWRRGVV
jgi:hypothetical protein